MNNFKEWMVKSILVRAQYRDDELAELAEIKKYAKFCHACGKVTCDGVYCNGCHRSTHYKCVRSGYCVDCYVVKCKTCGIHRERIYMSKCCYCLNIICKVCIYDNNGLAFCAGRCSDRAHV